MDTQTPSMDSMTQKVYSVREWFTFYKNTWLRNSAARAIDVYTDTVLLAKEGPEFMVEDGRTGQNIPVKIRLELRKMNVQDAIEIVKAADALLALTDEEIEAKCFSEEALKAYIPEAKVGDVCNLDDGSGEGVLADMDGKLVCVAKEDQKPESEATEPVEPVAEDPQPEETPVEATPEEATA